MTDSTDFPGVPSDLLRSLERSREDIAAGRVSDAAEVERRIQARVERMLEHTPFNAPRMGMG